MSSEPDLSRYCPQYVPPAGGFDEMCTHTGRVRRHWAYLSRSLQDLGPDEIKARQGDVARLLRGDGASYNVYGAVDGLNRPWGLDPIPMLIASEEWAGVEAGLLQRAELLNLILADLYGPGELVRQGLVAPEVIYSHGGFLRPCISPERTALPRMTLYAGDLARDPDGRIWVINDRTQAPSGVGYALENRTVMSRVMPSLFRESHPHRLAHFFRVLRAALAALVPRGRDAPRIVVWTPGPHNETYFEHAYLANYLGYTLVEGGDLTVRDGQVWLKTLSGLESVDVILRRVDAQFCDPLELRADSRLGVVGLLEMVRRGTVAVANPLGAGVLENPGLMPFLPGLAKHFFGHELRLPSVPTWWCGQAIERDYVLANLHRLVIRPINRGVGTLPVFGDRLSQAEREQWRTRIRARPHLYVGQERLDLATVPLWVDGSLQPRRATVRAYLAAEDDSFVVMPGGLTRVGAEGDSTVISNQVGAISKDTWVLASEPERQEDLWSTLRGGDLDSGLQESLPGRAAENLFWLARYAERAEGAIRLIRIVRERLNETLQFEDARETECLRALLRGLTQQTGTYPGFVGDGADARLAQPYAELRDLVLNQDRSGTLAANLLAMLNAAQSVRDLVSADTWRVINDIGDSLARLGATPAGDIAAWQDALDRLITALMALAGLSHESMSRGYGWHLLCLGRRIERALLGIALVRAVGVPVHSAETEGLLWESVLAAAESLTAYRRRYRVPPRSDSALELLLLDDTHPRSLVFQVGSLHRHLEALPGQAGRPLSREMRGTLEVLSRLTLAERDELTVVDEQGGLRRGLDAFLSDLSGRISEVSVALADDYFTHVQRPYQLLDPS